MRRLVSFSQAVALLVAAVAVGYGAGVGIGSVISGTWMTRELLKPIGFTVSSVGAGTGELVVAEEPKEVLPPTVFVAHGPFYPAISPEEEIPPRTPVVVAVPVVAVVPTTPALAVKPEKEEEWINILPREDFLRGQSFRRFSSWEGKTYEDWSVAFALQPGTQIRTPFPGRVSTTGRGRVDGKWYPGIYIEGELDNRKKFAFFVLGPAVRPSVKNGSVVDRWTILGEVVDTSLPFEGRYSVLIDVGVLGVVDSTMLYINDLPLLKRLFPHVSF